MKEIKLSGKLGKDKSVKVDDDDYKKYNHLVWHLSDTGYAVRRDNHQTYRLHRLIMNCPEGMVIDHLNGDKLDCRKSNLRICTQQENAKNIHGVKGYCFDKNRGKYIARYKGKFCGRYLTEDEAIRAYQLAKSGKEYVPKRRQKYMLPKHIYRQGGKWGWGFSVKGVRYRKNGYATLAEAQEQLEIKLREMRITS